MKKFVIGVAIATLVAFVAAFVLRNVMHIVPVGYRAAVTDMEILRPTSYENGVVWGVPFVTKVVLYDVHERTYAYSFKVKGASMQDITMSGALVYHLNGDEVVRLYQAVGRNYQPVLITPLLEGAVNQIIGTKEPEFVVSNQEMIGEALLYIMQNELGPTGLVEVSDFRIFRPEFDPTFEAAIKDKVVAQQIAEKAKFETKKVEEEAKQMKLKLEAEAYGLDLKSEAMKNPLIVEYEYAKAFGKWEGKLPSTLMMGQSSIPVLQVGK